ncbi:MAG TPA: DUF1801 domain-containing protein [Phycisphaerales bacterium]|nr:DUF1801 domain-containing protein [Phycisphaerales bacterium]
MQSKAATVAEYLASLPADRRAAIEAVRKVVLKNLDKSYQETMQYGMIGYSVPHSVYPAGYHCDPKQPLPFAAIASQKNYMSLYLMSPYCGCVDDPEHKEYAHWFRDAWAKTGKKLDMGKSCIRFTKVDDLALDVIGEAIKKVPAKRFIEGYEAALGDRVKKPAAKAEKTSAKTKATKPVAKKKVAAKAGTPVRKAAGKK